MQTLYDYVGAELSNLETAYHWPVPKIDGFRGSGRGDYQENVRFKQFLNHRWLSAKDDVERLEVARLVISKWGGVHANKLSTLKKYVKMAKSPAPETPHKGVSSYSKLLSIAHIGKFAIYDARVAACLNAIQVLANVKNGFAFRYCSGRNNVVGHVGKKVGFTQRDEFKLRNLKVLGWHAVSAGENYSRYLALLNSCKERFPDHEMHDFEMILFANAERECRNVLFKSGHGIAPPASVKV